MASQSKPLTLARLEDLTLGSFAFLPSSETLDHLVRFLSTWSGSDKFFMIIQYTVKLLVPFLHWRARLQYGAGLRKAPVSASAGRLSKLSGIIGDARMLFRIWGLLPIFQWMITMERNPSPTRKLRTIERLQGWSMLGYYPLEHLYYLLSHSIIPDTITLPSITAFIPFIGTQPSEKSIPLKLGSLGLWSTRFWAAYVILQLAHLREDSKLLRMRERTLSKTKTGASAAEKEDISKRRKALRTELIVNLAYLPQTLHWSTEKGIFENEVSTALGFSPAAYARLLGPSSRNSYRICREVADDWKRLIFGGVAGIYIRPALYPYSCLNSPWQVWLDICGLIAGIASWRSGWEATALKPAPSLADMTPVEPTEEKLAPHVDDILADVVEAPSLDEM